MTPVDDLVASLARLIS